MDKLAYEYLVHLVACGLRGQQPKEPPRELSFEKVLSFGKAHEVANIAYLAVQRLQRKPEPELLAKWKAVHALSLRRHANQMAARDAISQGLSEAGVRHLELQGTVMKTLYPQPYLRMMSDMDFIIDPENLHVAEGILRNLGYRIKPLPDIVEVNAYGSDGIAVEMHTDFFAPGSLGYGVITDPFSYAQPGDGYALKGSATIFYLYNLLHTLKHYLNRGCGIRRIMDIYILRTQVWEQTDQSYVQKVLEENGYTDAAQTLLALADRWFGDGETEADLSRAEELVYLAGNHGSYQVSLVNEYKSAGQKRFYKLRKFRELLFPSKDYVYLGYPRCKELKLPLLFCWVYRWVYLLAHRKRRESGLSILSDVRKTKFK